MIKINRIEDCVGCNACVQRCPKACISMKEDEQGFSYPLIDLEKCIDCHLCEKVCPVINQAKQRKPIATYAAKNHDPEIQESSSSGGAFFALAQKMIEEGGVVFGAKFNKDWEVVHGYAETIDGVRAFQGSKYVQSSIGETYVEAEGFLKSGRKVLFSGTPCQIAGLKRYLMKDYGEMLLTVDIVCHGVPSPLVWRNYLKYIFRPEVGKSEKDTDSHATLNPERINGISRISFRDKRISWEKFGFSVLTAYHNSGQNSNPQSTKCDNDEREFLYEPHAKNLFMQGFLKNLYLRPSCYECPAKCGKSTSDITLGDFWKEQEFYPDYYQRGLNSLILTNSEKGSRLLSSIGTIELEQAEYENALRGNSAIERSVQCPKQYSTFWKLYYQNGIPAITEVCKSMQPKFIEKCYRHLKSVAGRFLRKIHIIR